jgi:hypothetical protein
MHLFSPVCLANGWRARAGVRSRSATPTHEHNSVFIACQRRRSIPPFMVVPTLSLKRPSSTPWKTVALEIVEGLGKAVALIVSTVAVVVLGIVLAAMSSLP